MPPDPSAYAALGLEPGADWAEVERAFKELIKLHHPDRPGGDSRRAAEIMHAYRELKRARGHKDELAFAEDEVEPAPARRGWVLAAVPAAVALGLLLLALGPLADVTGRDTPARIAGLSSKGEPMDRPLTVAAIDGSVREAITIARTQDEMALARTSQDCHRQLRSRPSLELLDRCVGFDDAVVQLQDRDPLRDQGPFSEIAVTSRQMSAASILSGDPLAIDGRLSRIRLHVELTLAPVPPD